MKQRILLRVSALSLGLACSAGAGCNAERKESEQCVAARSRARTATERGELDAARTGVQAAKAACGRASEYDIDRLERAIEREARHRSRAAARQKSAGALESPLTAFLGWVRSEREEKNRAKHDHDCEPRDSALFGFCTSQLPKTGRAPFVVRYWSAAPSDIYRFSWSLPAPLTCTDTGAHRLVGNWQHDGNEHSLCELTDHNVRGLKALIVRSQTSSEIHIYSAQYPTKDTEFASHLERL